MIATEHLLEVIHQLRILRERLPEIRAGAEVTSRAREHHASDVGIASGGLECLGEE